MKPYIGILIDSFWEAVSNRVLWALLVCWTILLGLLAPFGYVTERSFELVSSDIDNRVQLIEKIDKAAKGNGGKSAQAVVAQLDKAFVQKVQKSVDSSNVRIRSSELAEELNKALKSPDLYSEEAFPTADKRKKLQPLIEMDPSARSEEDNQELNRKLVQLAFPLELEENFGERLAVGYAGFKVTQPLPFSRRTAREFIEPLVLSAIVKFGLGVIAVFVAVIVTSPIIPDTFRSGSLHLLLSKPISRVLLYLSKFFGGTIFVFVNISFFLTGLFLIAGIRFDIWNPGLLYSIPLLLFVFAIFYSVSGHVGLVWGNAIVCVVACILFWFCCFCLGFARGIMQPEQEVFPQISKVTKIGEDLAIVNQRGDFSIWNTEFEVWQPAINSEGRGAQRRTFGPIYDPVREKVLIKSFVQNPFGGVFSRSRALDIIDLADEEDEFDDTQTPASDADPQSEAEEGKSTTESSGESEPSDSATDEAGNAESSAQSDDTEAEETVAEEFETDDDSNSSTPKSASEARSKPRWVFDEGPELPAQCFDLVEMNGDIIAICRSGFFKLDSERLDAIEAGEKALFGLLSLTQFVGGNAFEKISPDGYLLSDKASPSPTASGNAIVVHTPEKLEVLNYVDGKFEIAATLQLKEEDGEGTQDAVASLVRMNDAYCVLAREGMPFELYDNELKSLGQIEWNKKDEIKQMQWQPGSNKLSIVLHSGELLCLNCDTKSIEDYEVPVSGHVTSISWASENEAWIACQPEVVYQVDVTAGKVTKTYDPAPSIYRRVYDLGINPLYTLLPKPAALDDAMLYLLSGRDTQNMGVVSSDFEAPKLELSIWPPILSNLAFVVVVLGLSCLYVARKEF